MQERKLQAKTVLLAILLIGGSAPGGGSEVSANSQWSSSTSLLSFCVSDGPASSKYFLHDLTPVTVGQSLFTDDWSQGRLMLGGNFLPNPKIAVSTADGSR